MGFSRQEHWSGLPFPSPKWTIGRKKVKLLSHVLLFPTPWTVAYQAPPSMAFSRQEYWRGLPFPSPGDLPNTGIEPRSPALQADALLSELPEQLKPRKLLSTHAPEPVPELDSLCTATKDPMWCNEDPACQNWDPNAAKYIYRYTYL